MKSVAALLATLFFTVSNAQSQNLNEIEHSIRNGNSRKVAALITSFLSKENSLNELRSLIHLLESSPIKNQLSSKINSHDVSALILSRISDIPLSNEKELKVKCILAHQDKSGKVFRYHIIFLKDFDKKQFMKKVKLWVLRNYPA